MPTGKFLALGAESWGEKKLTEKHRIAVVEDNPAQRIILSRLLEGKHQVTTFDSGTAFLNCTDPFDAVLLDIEMPGPNGYETCRELRRCPERDDIPVLFVSAHDSAPERVAAYEAGGDDFIAKPIDAHELQYKVNATIARRQRLRELSDQSSNAQQVAFTAMLSMSDLGVVIEFLRKSTQGNSYETIGQQLIEAMAAWGLRGAVQVRGRKQRLNLGTDDEMSSLQVSVLDTLQDIGRIFVLGPRAVINYDRVSLLIQNLPVSDPDKVGRLRDHLAILAESADLRLAGLDAALEHHQQKADSEGILKELRRTLKNIGAQTQHHRQAGQAHLTEQLEYLNRTLQGLGFSDLQKSYVGDLLQETIETTVHFFDESIVHEEQYADILERLSAPLPHS